MLDDGKVLKLARVVVGAKLKRWKVWSVNRTVARQQEALIKTELMKGMIPSSQAQPVLFKDWGLRYIELEEVKWLRSYRDRQRIVRQQLVSFFGSTLLQEITPG